MPAQLPDRAAVEAAFAADRFLLFKHSRTCPISAAAFKTYEAFCAAHPDVPTGWLDVRAQRAEAQWVAERTGVTHASPQALLLRAGAVAWHANHWNIDADALAKAAAEG